MVAMKAAANKSLRFLSVQSLESPVQFSLLQHLKVSSRKADTPFESGAAIKKFPKKHEYVCHELAVNLIRRAKNSDHALETFNQVAKQRGFHHNDSTYAVLLRKLAQFKKYDSLDVVLHQMTYETCKFHEGSFLVLMKHFSKMSMHDKVVEMFNLILPIVRSKPSLKAISTCLNLLVEASEIGLAKTFLLSTRKDFRLEPNACIFNILVKHHCKTGDIESAFELVKVMEKSEMSLPNLITYSTLIDGLCRSGRLREAIDLLEEMISKHQIVPDALTYNLLIRGFCHGGKTNEAKKVMEFMNKNGCHPNIFNYSTLMNGLCRDGKLGEAKEIFEEMKDSGLKPDAVVYTTLINFMCRAGRTDDAIELLEEMKEINCKPDEVTFNVILSGLCREYRYHEALGLLERLQNDGVHLNKASYRIVLNFLLKEGELEKAVDLLVLMLRRGFLPHFGTSNELLVSLCKAGKANDAATVLFGLLDMGFKPEPDTWSMLVELNSRERRLLPTFELLENILSNGI